MFVYSHIFMFFFYIQNYTGFLQINTRTFSRTTWSHLQGIKNTSIKCSKNRSHNSGSTGSLPQKIDVKYFSQSAMAMDIPINIPSLKLNYFQRLHSLKLTSQKLAKVTRTKCHAMPLCFTGWTPSFCIKTVQLHVPRLQNFHEIWAS